MLLEIAVTLDRNRIALAQETLERRVLESSLQAASTTIRELQQQLMTTNAELSAWQDRERGLARDLAAWAARSGSIRAVEEQPDELMAVARQAANTIMETARAAALEVLRSARAAAQTIRGSVDAALVIDERPARRDDS